MPDAPLPERPVRAGMVRQGDRDKAYRPLPLEARRAALTRASPPTTGEYFAAHEALEPAWMGTDDLPERALHQGLIKVAAAYVHAGRGNATGIAKNLAGARRLLALAEPAASAWGVDLPALVADIDVRLGQPDLAPVAPPIGRTVPA